MRWSWWPSEGIRPELIVILSDINMPGMDGLTLLRENSSASVSKGSAARSLESARDDMHSGDVLASVIDVLQLCSDWALFSLCVRSRRVAPAPSTVWRRASRRALRCGQPACAGQSRPRHGLGERPCMPQ